MQKKHSERGAHLPEGVKLLPLRDGELPSLVPVDAIVQHLPLMQQAQRVGATVISGPDPERERAQHGTLAS